MNYSLLYFGTFAMILFCITIVLFVLWAGRQFNIQKQYNEKRDKFYMKRIDELEHIVKTECKELFNQLKKYHY